MMPAFFICHGAPLLAIQENEYTAHLKQLKNGLAAKPKAIVVFSAHYEREVTTITYRDDVYETVYDFYGFPDELYQIKYPARGSKQVADQMAELFREEGVALQLDAQSGLDHGTWVVLHHMYPQAEIPVIQVSVNLNLPPAEQYRIGRALRSLREQDVLVIGSGGTSHNLRSIDWSATEPADWTVAFDDWVIDKARVWDTAALFDYEQQAPYAKMAVPRAEHFVPFFLAMGSADRGKEAGGANHTQVTHRSYEYGTLSHIVFCFE
ncbi:dioxygenase family protein [Brevibacillus dissolubilis]|uniref:dioxygenase family protein n=1 Tax=Brevibacillus dissolubilis TaxID=1844116 RepID=UPI0011178738|nr:class III extradiol ring-cleavage dioxygenase [Brevibacillus dissolubilis]